MAYELTKDEKLSIITQHQKAIAASKYDIEISIDEENSTLSPNGEILAYHQTLLADATAKLAVLQEKLEELE